MISNLRQIKHLYVEQEYLVIYILDSKEVGEGYETAPIVGSLKPCEHLIDQKSAVTTVTFNR